MDLEDLKKKKISDLRYIGKMLGIKSMTKMTKQELIEAILDSEQKSANPEEPKTEAAESKEETAEPAAEPEQEQEQERPAPAKGKKSRKSGTSKRQKKNEASEGAASKTEENAEQEEKKDDAKPQDNTEEAEGLLEILPEGYGFLRVGKYLSGSKDVYVPPTLIR